LGNRNIFNEFIINLKIQYITQSYFIAIIDIDRFKEINDALGHQEGDNALKDMARIIKKCVRHTDLAIRYGGDEFIIAARMEQDAGIIMTRVESAIKNHNEYKAKPYILRISHGEGVFRANGDEKIEDFLARIDRLMYQRKEERRRADAALGEAEGGKSPVVR
jgi:diguanylate cyclase (GGDEF)-like protein